MIIVLAWPTEDFRVVTDAGYDLGKPRKTEKILVGSAAVWSNNSSGNDLEKAAAYVKKESQEESGIQGIEIFTYPDSEPDPLSHARQQVLENLKPKRKI